MKRTGRLRNAVRGLGYLLVGSGLDPRGIANMRHLGRFRRDLRAFRKLGGKVTALHPIITDYGVDAGVGSGMYFHQDLLVAALVHDAAPRRHIDIGSLVSGFVAHVAAFREIELIDIRPLPDSPHHRIKFVQADLMQRDEALDRVADSVSCLNAIEHFGLGRYGDQIDPSGHIAGFRNIARMVKPGGRLYISFPIGQANQVFFNAHRVFEPTDIFSWFGTEQSFVLERFDYVDDAGDLHPLADVHAVPPLEFGCGIYTFRAADA